MSRSALLDTASFASFAVAGTQEALASLLRQTSFKLPINTRK